MWKKHWSPEGGLLPTPGFGEELGFLQNFGRTSQKDGSR